MTSAGRRNRLVMIQRGVDSKGGSGYPVTTWSDLGTAWMSREDVVLRGSTAIERIDVAQVAARSYTEWTLPFQADMDPESVDVPKTRRLVYSGRVYDIVSARIADEEVARRHITLQTVASSKVAA